MTTFDISHFVGGDLLLSPSGDIGTVSASDKTQQRILRRLLTNLSDYIWHPAYGAGLPSFIGKPSAPATIKAVIRGQIALEASVAKSPAPVITVTMGLNNSVFVDIQYTDSGDGTTQTVSFPIG